MNDLYYSGVLSFSGRTEVQLKVPLDQTSVCFSRLSVVDAESVIMIPDTSENTVNNSTVMMA